MGICGLLKTIISSFKESTSQTVLIGYSPRGEHTVRVKTGKRFSLSSWSTHMHNNLPDHSMYIYMYKDIGKTHGKKKMHLYELIMHLHEVTQYSQPNEPIYNTTQHFHLHNSDTVQTPPYTFVQVSSTVCECPCKATYFIHAFVGKYVVT